MNTSLGRSPLVSILEKGGSDWQTCDHFLFCTFMSIIRLHLGQLFLPILLHLFKVDFAFIVFLLIFLRLLGCKHIGSEALWIASVWKSHCIYVSLKSSTLYLQFINKGVFFFFCLLVTLDLYEPSSHLSVDRSLNQRAIYPSWIVSCEGKSV